MGLSGGTGRPSGRASRIRKVDARVVVFLGLLMGILIWQAGIPGLLAYGLLLALLLYLLGAFRSTDAAVLRTYLVFVVSWVAIKLVFDALDDGLTPGIVADSGVLGLRLLVLLCLSLALAVVASPFALGAAVSWYARPFLRSRAWQAALALSLMVHFLPMTWRTLSRLRQSMERRCPQLPLRRRLVLLPQAALRVLSQMTWAQSMAIAARRLDRPEAWSGHLTFRKTDLAVTLVAAPVVVALALL